MADAHDQSVAATTTLLIGLAVAGGGLVVALTSPDDDGSQDGDVKDAGPKVAAVIGPAPGLSMVMRW